MGVDIHDLTAKPKLHAYKLQQFKDKFNALYILKTVGVGMDTLRSFIYRQGQPDLIILDYADKLVSARKYSDRRFEIEDIYNDMIKMSDEFNCSFISASQTNRQGMKKEKVTMEDFAEAFAKGAIAEHHALVPS
jgi:replicative DNA helicase